MAKPRGPLWKNSTPRKTYDVVIIGGGLHGLGCAYYLAKDHGLTNVAVLERNHFGYGGSGRNTEVIRANQRAEEIIPFYKASYEMWQELSRELDFNLMVRTPGMIGLIHTEASLNAVRMRAETGKRFGLATDFLSPREIKKIVPELDISARPAMPVIGGYSHPSCGTVRHDAAVWGYAAACSRLGVDLCPGVEATGIKLDRGPSGSRATGVKTNAGTIKAGAVLNAAGGWSTAVARLAGVRLPNITLPLQALVTEPIKPFLNVLVVSEHYFVYVQQSLKGELVMGSHMDPYRSYSIKSGRGFVKHQAQCMMELFPSLSRVKLMRQWTGLTDMTPDHAPIMGRTEVEGFFLDVGWGYFGFKSAPMAARLLARYMASGKRPEMLAPLRPGALRKRRSGPRERPGPDLNTPIFDEVIKPQWHFRFPVPTAAPAP